MALTPRRTAIWAAAAGLTACALSPPERPGAYAFRSQLDSLVFRWPATRLPVRFLAPPLGAIPAYVDAGIRVWESQFLFGEFSGVRTADSAAADVRVELEGTAPPEAALTDSPAVEACEGRTSIPVSAANRLDGAIVIRLRWFGTYPPEHVANCLARVTAHEIGHALGLLQHSDDARDLMFGAPYGFPQVREPSARDRATVQHLYHTAPDLTP